MEVWSLSFCVISMHSVCSWKINEYHGECSISWFVSKVSVLQMPQMHHRLFLHVWSWMDSKLTVGFFEDAPHLFYLRDTLFSLHLHRQSIAIKRLTSSTWPFCEPSSVTVWRSWQLHSDLSANMFTTCVHSEENGLNIDHRKAIAGSCL